MNGPTVADVVSSLERRYPTAGAEDWDAVGLVVGDPRAQVRRVLFAVDPVSTVVDEALEWGADLLVVHHPLFLDGVHSVAADSPRGRLVHRLIGGGCALYVAHTNADSAHRGVAHALAEALGLTDCEPLVPRPAEALDKLVVFVPDGHEEAVVDALSAAGAGALGEYERCAWSSPGTGTFVPSARAEPALGRAGEVARVRESRVEMIAPRSRRARVIEALRAAHPYEEPAFDVLELASWPSAVGTGRVGRLAGPLTLDAFARRVADALPATAQGVRVAGDLAAEVRTVAVVGGSGGSLLDVVRARGVDAYVTADLRHHPVSELREHAVDRDPAPGGPAAGRPVPAVVDVAHFASEWPWLELAADDLVADLREVAAHPVPEVRVSTRRTDPWTARYASGDDPAATLDPQPIAPRGRTSS